MQSFRLIFAALLTMGVSATNTTTMTMTTTNTVADDDQTSVSSGSMAAPSIVAVAAWYGWQAFTTFPFVGVLRLCLNAILTGSSVFFC